jgi:hypothetical protein
MADKNNNSNLFSEQPQASVLTYLNERIKILDLENSELKKEISAKMSKIL